MEDCSWLPAVMSFKNRSLQLILAWHNSFRHSNRKCINQEYMTESLRYHLKLRNLERTVNIVDWWTRVEVLKNILLKTLVILLFSKLLLISIISYRMMTPSSCYGWRIGSSIRYGVRILVWSETFLLKNGPELS